ncbi:MAG: hypothetical protein DLM60_07965 [Pseudonocardiales bacterium]|nr:MAG: hypothetical protein DLM60_07965 [Pseudonocardiales bacterium]
MSQRLRWLRWLRLWWLRSGGRFSFSYYNGFSRGGFSGFTNRYNGFGGGSSSRGGGLQGIANLLG